MPKQTCKDMHTRKHARAHVHECVQARTHACACAHPLLTCQHTPQAAGGGGSAFPEQMTVDRSPPVARGGSGRSPGSGRPAGDALGRGSPPARRSHPHAPAAPPTRPLAPMGANTAARAAHRARMRASGAGDPSLSAPLPLAATLPGTPG